MQSHEKWLLKANNDLAAAKILSEANCLDVAIYHTQQAGEKALKGFLAAYEPIQLKSFSPFLGSFEPIFDFKLQGLYC